MTKSAALIGSGFGGLALAIRLQSAGVQTTIIEGRDKPGGRAYFWEKDGHIFDAGPTVITDPACLRELWELSGSDIATDVELMPVTPFYRLSWPDGTDFDYLSDDERLDTQIAALEPRDVAGYRRFLDYSAGVYHEGYVKLGAVPFLDFGAMLRAAPALARYQAWRSVYSVVSGFVRNEKLRQALSFHTLLVGGNPMTTSAIYALIHKLERDGGVWFARGGTNRLIAGMVRHFERLGGTLRLGDPVERIETKADRVTTVHSAGGWSATFDAIASNADIVRTYDMVGHPRGTSAARRLRRKRFSPSLFVVHFRRTGCGPMCRTIQSSSARAIRGCSTRFIAARGCPPTPRYIYTTRRRPIRRWRRRGNRPSMCLRRCRIWAVRRSTGSVEGPRYAQQILKILEQRTLPGLSARIDDHFVYGPSDFESDLNSHLGSAFSLEPILTQSAWFRVHNRDDVLSNLYFVGAGTHPGAGIPGVVGSAKATAGLMLQDLAP
jgi:phytoene desaturase